MAGSVTDPVKSAEAACRGQRVEHGPTPVAVAVGAAAASGPSAGTGATIATGAGAGTSRPVSAGTGRGPSPYRWSRRRPGRRATAAVRRSRGRARRPHPLPRDLAPTAAPPPAVRRSPRRRRPGSSNWTRSPTLDAGTAPVGRPVVARPTRAPTPGATNRGLRRHSSRSPRAAATSTRSTTTRGRIRLDRTLFTATQYPADYGFIEDTLGEDGDPLDALVLLSRSRPSPAA